MNNKTHEVDSIVRTWTKYIGYFLTIFGVLCAATILLPILPAVWFNFAYFSFGKVVGLLVAGFFALIAGIGLLALYQDDKSWQ